MEIDLLWQFPGETYLSCYFDKIYNILILTIINTDIPGRYFNVYNLIDLNKNIHKYYLELDKHQLKGCLF